MKNFLKFVCVFLSLFLIGAISVSAEGSINANEQAILEKIQAVYEVGSRDYAVPVEYVNQARNFFLTVDVSKAQSDEILGYIDGGLEILDTQVHKFGSGDVNFERFDSSAKKQILDLGQKAAAVVDLKLVYADGGVTITDLEGSPVFNGSAVIKVTGANEKHMLFGAVSFTVIAVSYVICLLVFRKKESNE